MTHGAGAKLTDTVIALIDPDQVFLRPLTVWVGNETNSIVTRPVKLSELPIRVAQGNARALVPSCTVRRASCVVL